MSDYKNKDESYRNTLATSEVSGKRKWIYAKKPFGKYYNLRSYVSYFLLFFLFTGPFYEYNGHPLFMFNFPERLFIVFGVAFWPQDFYIFVFAFLALLLFIVLFTSVFGRVWCGWACPQTIFMEMLFRKIEYFIEGDSGEQKRVNAQPYSLKKASKKIIKHIIFFLLSFLIANTFLAYIIGKQELFIIIFSPVSEHIVGFTIISIFTFVFYLVFAQFREQACVVVCPYGRYQSVLVDENTIAVTYDFVRGEPREKPKRKDVEISSLVFMENKVGDCIDCHQCVRVCPTGIDIRNGIQLECINCTACMDACDDVMIKINKAPELIKYASYANISKGASFKFTPKIIAYISVLTILVIALFGIFISRKDADILILRQSGTMFQKPDETHYTNLFRLKINNKSFSPMSADLKIITNNAQIKMITQLENIPAQETKEFMFFVEINKKDLLPYENYIDFNIITNNKDTKVVSSTFIAPDKQTLEQK